MQVSCAGCDIFGRMRPLEKVYMFRAYFALLHKDYENDFEKYIDLIGKLLNGDNDVKLESIWCCKGRDVISNSFRDILEPQREETYRMLNLLGNIVGENVGVLHKVREKLKKKGAYNQLFSSGIGQRPYFNEGFVHLLSEEETKQLFLFDYKMKRKDKRYYYLDLIINLELPLNDLVDSFKSIVKEKQATLYKELYKADGKPNVPDFELWHNYILAYTLKEKGVKASLLNPEWPNKKLSRKEAAELLFPRDEDKLQKLDRYIREAKKLINQAKNHEGPFKIFKLEASSYL